MTFSNLNMFRFLLILLVFLSSESIAQNYVKGKEIYRVIAIKHGQTEIESVSNTAEAIKSTTTYLPNAFSPDGDGINDDFGFIGENVENYALKIYNRWGELLFQTNDIPKKWDGTYKGEIVAEGVYVYTLNANESLSGKNINKTGTVTVLR